MNAPEHLAAILAETAALGFTMSSELLTGSLLRTLAASKPGGMFLELGTGTGVGSAWLLTGMDASARLWTVDNDDAAIAVARKHLGADKRVTFYRGDAGQFIGRMQGWKFDLVFADTWAGKFTHRVEAMSLVKTGGLYIVDDLLPQASWPDAHAVRVPPLIEEIENQPEFAVTRMDWATGLIIATRIASQN